MRVAIYARYSSDLQTDASIEIQVEECQKLANQRGWSVVEVYADHGISGRTVSQRPDFNRMLADAEEGKFDLVLALHSDRISRDVADMTALYRDLSYLNIEIHTVHEGHQDDPLLISVRGAMNEQYSRELGRKTKLGQRKRVAAGKKAGGKAYGYRVVDPIISGKHIERGDREVLPEEAAIVRRIFEEYASGLSPRAIARQLNAEGVPGPRGKWIDTTIRGQRNRGTGILNNDNYRGFNSWDKCPYSINPKTGKRVARPNPKEEWVGEVCEEWRIVSDELWDAVKEQQERNATTIPKQGGVALNRLHRKKHLLSGIVRCGCCQGPMAINNGPAYSCSNRRRKGTCENLISINRRELENRVLAGIKNELLRAEYVAQFVTDYEQEIKNLEVSTKPKLDTLEKKRRKIARAIDNLIEAVKVGKASEILLEELAEQERQLETLDTSISLIHSQQNTCTVPNQEPTEVYWAAIVKLHNGMTDPATKCAAMNILRSLIEEIVVGGNDDDPERITLSGDAGFLIENIQTLKAENPDQDDGSGLSMLSVVAGVGFEPTTFRL